MDQYLRDISVMIVDGHDFHRNVMREIVRVLGPQEVIVLRDGHEAWEAFKYRPADIVITEWDLGTTNGLKLAQKIRKDPDSPNVFTPIIMATAYRDADHVFTARDAGVTEYVIKPLSPKALFSRIEAVIERPRRFVRVGEFFGPDRRRHKTEFMGEERRGVARPKPTPEQAAAAKHRELAQEEINQTFNPDDAPRKSAAQ